MENNLWKEYYAMRSSYCNDNLSKKEKTQLNFKIGSYLILLHSTYGYGK